MTHDTRQARGRYRTGDDDLPWTGERQVGRTLEDIRPDHVERYKWAAQRLPAMSPVVLDVGCGVGYGSNLLAPRAMRVEAVDIDQRTIDYARKHWAHAQIEFQVRDVMDRDQWDGVVYDAIVALEVLEHVSDLPELLRQFAAHSHPGTALLCSTPNQSVRPYSQAKFPYHFRHYTRVELCEALRAARFIPTAFFLQDDAEVRPHSETDPAGKFLLAMAVRA